MPMAYQSYTQTVKLWPVLFSHLWSHLSRETTVLIQVIQAQVYNPHLVKLHSIWVTIILNFSEKSTNFKPPQMASNRKNTKFQPCTFKCIHSRPMCIPTKPSLTNLEFANIYVVYVLAAICTCILIVYYVYWWLLTNSPY